MKDEDLESRLVWREPLGALVGAALSPVAFAIVGGMSLLHVLMYLPFFVLFVFHTAPFALAAGLATGETIRRIHLKTGKTVGGLLSIGIGAGYSTALACLLVWLFDGGGGYWTMAVLFGVTTGTSAGLFSEGGDVKGAAGGST